MPVAVGNCRRGVKKTSDGVNLTRNIARSILAVQRLPLNPNCVA